MKRTGLVLTAVAVALIAAGTAVAGDFDWVKELNVKAVNDPSGFKAQLAARFKIGETQVSTVIGSVTQPADAYMVLRLGEMSARPTQSVIDAYNAGKGQGWGKLAKSLGIKPGSPEFHALKRGHDLSGGGPAEQGKGKGKGSKQKKKKDD